MPTQSVHVTAHPQAAGVRLPLPAVRARAVGCGRTGWSVPIPIRSKFKLLSKVYMNANKVLPLPKIFRAAETHPPQATQSKKMIHILVVCIVGNASSDAGGFPALHLKPAKRAFTFPTSRRVKLER